MDTQQTGARNGFALFAIGLFLGPILLMFWLGRWKWALFYFLFEVAALIGVLALVHQGLINPPSLPGVGLDERLALIALPLSAIGIIHGFTLNHGGARPFYSRWYIALVLPTVLSFAVAGVVRLAYRPFNIPSASNVPNLLVGDYVFVPTFAYTASHPPQRGDMAIFKYPGDPRIDYVKRIVGLPGDRIQMVHGVLNINDVPVKLEEVQLAGFLHDADNPNMKFYRETLPNGRSYVIGDTGDTELDNAQVYVVPEGHYFVLGDSRDNSQDSRLLDKVGYVPAGNFIGPVGWRFWNDRGVSMAERPEETYPKN